MRRRSSYPAPTRARLRLLVGASSREVADRPEDAIDDVGLALVGRRREREVRVAAGLVEERELRVDAATLAVRAPVREAPVAVDEGVARAPRGVAGEVPVLREEVDVLTEVRAQPLRRVVVVVEVELDLAEAARASAPRGSRATRGHTARRGRRRSAGAHGRRHRRSPRRASDSLRSRSARARRPRRGSLRPRAARSDRRTRRAGGVVPDRSTALADPHGAATPRARSRDASHVRGG